MLKQKIKQIKSGKLTAVKNLTQFGNKIKRENKKFNIFLHLNNKSLEQAKEIDKRIKQKKPTGKLAGLCFAVKSNILVQHQTANCASKVLENFTSPFNATVINKLIEQDAIAIGMVNMDEFACGASGETSAYSPTKNPKNPQLIPGGSSSGSAAAVSADLCDFALGSDTGGSIRNPASHCGVTGFKPSYCSVSRYGLIDMTMSFDQIGPLTSTPEDAQLIFNIIKGQDNFDTTTVSAPSATATEERRGATKDKRTKSQMGALTIGLVNTEKFCNKKISELIKQKTEQIAKQNKWKIKSINLPLDIALQTYYIIVYTEFFSATRKFDSRRFGFKIEEKCGEEVLRRILGGSEITKAEYAGKYYRNALQAREYIKQEFEKIFKTCDIIIMPTVPKLAHKLKQKLTTKEMYAYDVLTVLANLAQLPAISIPTSTIKEDNLDKHIGLQILAPRFQDNFLLEISKKFS